MSPIAARKPGKKQAADVEIKRLGDAYLVKWSKGILDAYIGVGVRKGDVLSVCWASQGQLGVSVFHIDKGPRLVGEWTMLGGNGMLQREILTPRKKGE